MQQLYAWSGLSRPLTWNLLSNRLIMLCTAVAFLVATGCTYFLARAPAEDAAYAGISIAAAVFVSWALARELHPDAPWAAFVVVALCSMGLWFWPQPQLLLLFHLLLCIRLINRSTGVAATPLDVVLLLCFTAWLLYLGQLMAGMLAAAAFWSNGRLAEPQKQHRYLILPIVIATAWAIAYQPLLTAPTALSIEMNILIIGLATAFALFSRGVKHIKSVGDANGKPLLLERVKNGQVILLLLVTVFTLWYGDVYFYQLSPAWAAFGGIFLYAAFSRTTQQNKTKTA